MDPLRPANSTRACKARSDESQLSPRRNEVIPALAPAQPSAALPEELCVRTGTRLLGLSRVES
jgi:hypothetical protein